MDEDEFTNLIESDTILDAEFDNAREEDFELIQKIREVHDIRNSIDVHGI